MVTFKSTNGYNRIQKHIILSSVWQFPCRTLSACDMSPGCITSAVQGKSNDEVPTSQPQDLQNVSLHLMPNLSPVQQVRNSLYPVATADDDDNDDDRNIL
jgi:hypothetical protein